MKPIAAVGLIEALRTLWSVQKVRDYRTKVAKSLAGDETVGRKLADEILSEIFAETHRLEKQIKEVARQQAEHSEKLVQIIAKIDQVPKRRKIL